MQRPGLVRQSGDRWRARVFRRGRALALAAAVLLAMPALVPATRGGLLHAQARAELVVTLPENPATAGPIVRAVGLMDDRRLLDHLHAGFPTRLTFRTELWSTGGVFNDLEGSVTWEVLVRYDRLDRSYQVARGRPGARPELLGRFTSLAEVAEAVARPYQPVITIPRRGRRYYYNTTLAVETLSANDLDEVERWLRGELRPAIRGEGSAGTAVTRGMRTLVARLIAGPQRTFSARTDTFFVP